MNKLLLFLLIVLYIHSASAVASEFTLLAPSSVPELSPEIISTLEADKCLVPKWVNEFGGVTVGEFAAEGQTDIAVICHYGEKAEIRIFWGGPITCESRINSYGEFISTVDEEYILDHYAAYGGPKPPAITHQAINDHIVEKASLVKYCEEGNWIELTGAD
jgi:hypothetical protein